MADQVLIATQRTDRPAYRFRSRLDGSVYGLRLVYVSRSKRWHVDVSNEDGEPIIEGLRVVTGISLLEPWRGAPGFPPGQLFAVDPSGRSRDPGRFDLRADIRLVYRPAADVAAAAGTPDEVL